MKALTTLFVVGMFLTAGALADDADDVKAAVQRYFTALNAGDANAFIQSRMPVHSVFAGGGLLERLGSLEEQKNNFQARVEAGEKLNLQVRHLDVRVYGNAALVTGYVMGTVTSPDGTIDQVRDQHTSVWVKQGGQWRRAHRHTSPLNIAPSQ